MKCNAIIYSLCEFIVIVYKSSYFFWYFVLEWWNYHGTASDSAAVQSRWCIYISDYSHVTSTDSSALNRNITIPLSDLLPQGETRSEVRIGLVALETYSLLRPHGEYTSGRPCAGFQDPFPLKGEYRCLITRRKLYAGGHGRPHSGPCEQTREAVIREFWLNLMTTKTFFCRYAYAQQRRQDLWVCQSIFSYLTLFR